jgi:hypothetical protein
MNTVMIIPTGIGCEIGGHAGDATPAAKLIGSVSDKLILHPNVVNASDINEMPENALYVEGSILDRFLEGDVQLEEVRSNRILVVVNKPARAETINAVSASRATLGIDARILELEVPLQMTGFFNNDGSAGGKVTGVRELANQVKSCGYDYDALAIASLIEVSKETAEYYWKNGGVNPWGGVEAIVSKLIATMINKPVAHAPVEPESEREKLSAGWYHFVCDPRVAAEIISECYLHCVLKGLWKAPRLGTGLTNKDIDYLITPMGCVGRPHHACMEAGIPIIAVKENKSVLNDAMPSDWIYLNNYVEVAGFLQAKKIGITIESVRRPLNETIILNGETNDSE